MKDSFEDRPLLQNNLALIAGMENDANAALDQLYMAMETVRRLGGQAGSLDRLLSPDVMGEVSEQGEMVDQQLEDLNAQTKGARDFVSDLDRQSRSMAGALRELSKIMQSSNIVALNARIVAQTHAHEPNGSYLVDLAEGISEIAREATQESDNMVELTEKISGTISEIGTTVSGHVKSMGNQMLPALRETRGLLALLQGGMETVHSGARVFGDFIAFAEQELAQIIGALQVVDRTNQRAGHVLSISEIAARFPRGGVEGDAIRMLIHEHQNDMARDLALCVADARHALDGIKTRLPAFLVKCAEITDAFPTDQLADHAPPMEMIQGRTDALQESSRAALTQLQTYDQQLRSHSDRLNMAAFKMRLASLNTIIACARGFSKARDMIVISQQINAVISSVPETFDVFVNSAGAINGRVNEWIEADAAGDAGDRENGTNMASVLNRSHQTLTELLRALGDNPVQTQSLLDRAMGGLIQIEEKLKRHHLPDQKPVSAYHFADGVDQSFLDTVQDIRDIYSMDSERAVHDTFFANLIGMTVEAPEPAKAAPSDAAEDDFDDILF